MFDNVPENIVICINESNTKILSKIKNISCYTIDCSDNWKSQQKKIINGNCILVCKNDSKYKYEYHGKCYENCSQGYLTDENNKCKCELDKCISCPPEALKYNLCTECNKDYYKIEKDILNIGEYINCYKEPKGYYLDQVDSLFKQCYHSCETCKIKGDDINHNCISCNPNYSFEIKKNDNFNCFIICQYYHYFHNEDNYHCI